jgi:hypothetical protein
VPLSRIAADLGIDRKTARKLRDAESDPSIVSTTRPRASRFAEHESFIRVQLRAGVPIAQIARDIELRSLKKIPYTSFWEYASKLAASGPMLEDLRFEPPLEDFHPV